MSEGLSYIAANEYPCVIMNVVRGGPGLGGILPSQCDYDQATRGGGNGDYHLFVLAPSNLQEAVDLIQRSWDYAFKYMNPVMILADGFMGQMMEPVEIKERTEERGNWQKRAGRDQRRAADRGDWQKWAVGCSESAETSAPCSTACISRRALLKSTTKICKRNTS